MSEATKVSSYESSKCKYCGHEMFLIRLDGEQWFYCDHCENNTRSIKSITKRKYKAWYGQWRLSRREAGDWAALGHDEPESVAAAARKNEIRYIPASLHEHFNDCWKWTCYGTWALQNIPNRSMRQWHTFHVSYPTMQFEEFMYFRRQLGSYLEHCI